MELYFTGAGMASCVGFDIINTAAAVRAGISRFSPIEGSAFYDEDELEIPLAGAPFDLLTKGFIQYARWLRLAEFAFKDLLAYSGHLNNSTDWARIPIIWVLPNCAEIFEWSEELLVNVSNRLTESLSQSVGLPLTTPENGCLYEGASGTVRALRALAHTFEQNIYDSAIVINVDSLLEPMVLQQLIVDERLKTPDNPVGLMAGEAAAVILVENKPAPHQPEPKSSNLATIYQVSHNVADVDRTDTSWRHLQINILAETIADSVLQVLTVSSSNFFIGDLYLDLNGEEWRSKAWGIAQVKLKASGKIDIESCREIVPATSWGDIGAASHGSALALAGRSFVRNYSKSNASLIISVSDLGRVGVTFVGCTRGT